MTRLPPLSRWITRAREAHRACRSAWREGGLGGVGRLAKDTAYWRFHPRVRRWNAESHRQREIDETFDRQFGVDTAGEILLTEVGIGGSDVARGHGRYRAVWTGVFHEAVGKLPIAFEQFTFVDYGSGKGKALLLASNYPFEEIVGVEFARPLHDIAEKNIAGYASPKKRCHTLRSECADALHFAPPERPLVCFFFNPFDDATTDAVVEKLVDSVRRTPREILVVYCNMRHVDEHSRAFKSRRGLRLIEKQARFLTFRVSPS